MMLFSQRALPGTGPSARTGNATRRLAGERGQALLETAITLPIVLLVAVSIFEFGRAYQTSQVITNAAREGARVAVLPSSTTEDVQARVTAYLRSGSLATDHVSVSVNRAATVALGGTTTASASTVTISYPFSFMVLNPVARLVSPSATLGAPITLTATAQMRNEAE